jgi:hypothetical protein
MKINTRMKNKFWDKMQQHGVLLTSNARRYDSHDPRLNRSNHHLSLLTGFYFAENR